MNGVDVADITGGTGNDDFDLSNVVTGREISASMGAGNDTVTIGAAPATSTATLVADVIDGGGTDILGAATAVMAITAAGSTGVSNFETLQVSDGHQNGLTTSNVQAGITTVNLAAGVNADDSAAITFDAGASTLNIATSLTGALALNDTGTATTDSLTINNSATAADDMFNSENLTLQVSRH